MSISLKTHKLLWGKSGNRCAFTDCRNELIADETETDDESIIGDEAHIVAKKNDGARGISDLIKDERDKYDNLILLCRIHHKIIDDQGSFYTVEKLREMKLSHENWVRNSLQVDQNKIKDDLMYASYIDEIVYLLDYQNWNSWTSQLISNGQPAISFKRLKSIEKIPAFIVSRFWPNRYIELENAFFNLKNILNDFLKVFHKYIDRESLEQAQKSKEDDSVYTEKIYHIDEWNIKLYQDLLEQYEYHVDLIVDLVIELTRAANFTCEKIREFVSPKFREDEGKLLITSGPFVDFSWKTYKVEYRLEEKNKNFPYNGLKHFMSERENRDMNIGKGISNVYFSGELDT